MLLTTPACAALSPREATVLHFVAWRYTNKQIAERLRISVKTIGRRAGIVLAPFKTGDDQIKS